MKNAFTAGAALALALVSQAFAAGPATLRVTKTADIQAPVDKVWATVKDFDALDKWHPGFAKDELVKGTNNKPGAVRSLTVKNGPTFTEELLAFDEANHSYRYRIIESPLPIQNYVSRLSVKPGKNGGSRVSWSGTFKRKNTSDHPPEAENDAAAKKLVSGVYEGGLANLKKMFGG